MSEMEKTVRGKPRDLFRGCLIGGAAGDALGYAVEFKRETNIFREYGEKGITEYELKNGQALISDDTQMTLFTATGLLSSAARSGKYTEAVHLAYMDWLQTQEAIYPLPGGARHSWLADVREMFSRRAPGNTCLAALGSGKCGTIEEPINNSKGCGGVMRVAPVGLYFIGKGTDAQTVARIGAEAAAITHGHILGWMPAAMLAQMIYEICRDGAGVREAAEHALAAVNGMWPATPEREYFTALMKKALELANSEAADLEAIHQLGEGWVAEETLAIAVFCAVRYECDFDRAIIASVNHNGDSDSTGAVTGNILGARWGLSGIPDKYTERLELKDVILKVADNLYDDCREEKNG